MRWNLGVAALASSWGFIWIIADHLQLGALSIVFWRIGLSVLAIGLGVVASGRTDVLRLGKSGRWTLLLGPGLALLWFCSFEAMKLSSVAVAVLATYTSPIFLAVLAPIFLPERLSRAVLVALPIALAGLALIALESNGSGHVRPLAILVGVSGAFLLAILVIIQKRIVRDVNPVGFSFWIDLFALVALVPVLPFAGRVLPSAGELGYLALVGVVFTALSGFAWLLLLRHVTAQAMAFLSYLEPVSASLLAWLILGQRLGAAVAVGGVLVLAAGAIVVITEPAEAAVSELAGLPRAGEKPAGIATAE
ncbi:MAG: DMT family transporter [Gaiellaceae bacterium]|jgi:drug/metabolite transporter (DMT)-like permease